jgi:UTP--glucose-1-phosphate uridylyltransferase
VDDPKGYGVVRFKSMENGCGPLERLKEKPGPEEAKNFENNGKYYALCGAYVFEPRIFDYIVKTKPGIKNEVQITDAMSLALKSGEKVYGVVLKGKYIDIGKWKTVLKTEKELLKNLDVEKCVKEREFMAEKIKKDEEENGR